jgi:protein transport protein SEC24
MYVTIYHMTSLALADDQQDMPDDAGVPDPTTGQVVMPSALNLSSAAIVPYGLYLLDDGVNQFL